MSFPSGQRALITGASGGIGEATARAFSCAGINVAMASRSREQLEAVAQAARKEGVEAQEDPGNFAKVHGVREQIEAIVSDFSPMEMLLDTDSVNANFDRAKMLTPQIVAQSILQTIQLPAQATIEALTRMPSAGVL